MSNISFLVRQKFINLKMDERDIADRLRAPLAGNAKRILITGGAGNVGSNIALASRLEGHRVLLIDNLSHGHRQTAQITGSELVEFDLEKGDQGLLLTIMRDFDPDVVVHTAALISVPESVQYPERYFNANFLGSLNLYDAMMRANKRKLVFSNTAAVFDGTLGRPLNEESPMRPASPYGRSKLFAAQALQNGPFSGYFNAVMFHYFNVYGAPSSAVLREDHGIAEESHVIPILLQVALYNLMKRYGLVLYGTDNRRLMERLERSRQKFYVTGTDFSTHDGTCIRDYISIRTMIYFHMLAINALISGEIGQGYHPFVLGTKEGSSVLQVLNASETVVRRELGLLALDAGKVTDIEDPGRIIPVGTKPRREGDTAFLVADPQRAIRVLAKGAETPGRSLEENIALAFWSMLLRPLGYDGGTAGDEI